MKSKLKTTQSGSVLLEVMISILVFSFGVLGIVGLQANMISSAAEAKYRNEASFFANHLLGEMAASDRSTTAALDTFRSPSGTRFINWRNAITNTDINTGLLGLPGAAGLTQEVDIVTENNPVTGLPARYLATVTVRWQSPGKPEHQHVVQTSITRE